MMAILLLLCSASILKFPVIRSRYISLLLALLLTTTIVSASMCGCQQRYALLMDLYTATNGAGWLISSGWNTTNDCNVDWYGVTCSAIDVTSVFLTSNRLVGTLPSSWWNMTALTSLALCSNSLQGTLPADWGSMTKLVSLQLYANSLSGSFGGEWSSMTMLDTLLLYSNKLSGTLPSVWSAMVRLVNLQLYSNALSGTLPASWSSM
ncbi:GP46-like surface antigen, putative, partial [Bodo saltans]